MVKKILISQPKPANDNSPYYEMERDFGVKFIFRPFIKVEKVSGKDFRQQKVNLQEFTAVVFTSRHAVDNFFAFAKDMRVQVAETTKYFCTSEAIALYIQKYVQYRKRKVFFSTTGKINDMEAQIIKHSTENYLVPLSSVHNDDIKKYLDAVGVKHTECVMYQTVNNDFTDEEKEMSRDIDMVVLFSPTGVKSLQDNFPDLNGGKMKIATFGPATAKAVTDSGLALELQAPTEKQPSITSALRIYLRDQEEE